MIIFDLDGTLIDISIRRNQLVKDVLSGLSKNKAMKIFNNEENMLKYDKPIEQIIELYQFYNAVKKKTVILTARSEKQRAVTLTQLKECGIDNPLLYMREDKDNRKDEEFKEEMLDKFIQQGHNIESAFDDQMNIAKLWRRRNIFCFDVAGYTKEF